MSGILPTASRSADRPAVCGTRTEDLYGGTQVGPGRRGQEGNVFIQQHTAVHPTLCAAYRMCILCLTVLWKAVSIHSWVCEGQEDAEWINVRTSYTVGFMQNPWQPPPALTWPSHSPHIALNSPLSFVLGLQGQGTLFTSATKRTAALGAGDNSVVVYEHQHWDLAMMDWMPGTHSVSSTM